MTGDKQEMLTRVSFPLVCITLIFNIKLFVCKAFKTTRFHSTCVKESNSIVSDLVEAIIRPLVVE